MQKIYLSRPEWYSPAELADFWGKSVIRVNLYTRTGRLPLSKLYGYDHYENGKYKYTEKSLLEDISEPVDEEIYFDQGWYRDGLCYKLKNVECFEREHPEELAGDQEERQAESQVSEKVAPQKRVKTPIRKPGVKNRLTLSLENARARLIRKNKKDPTCRQVKDYLKFDDPLGCVIDFGKDNNGSYLLWEDNSGKYHKIRDKSIANKLTKIRNESNGL